MQEAQLRQLFDMYYLPIMRYLIHLTGEVTAAQDLSQKVYLKLYHYGPLNLENPRAWLFRVATNLGYNYLRQRENRIRNEAAAYQAKSEATDVEEPAVRREEKVNVHQILESMSERDRTCLIMRFSGFSYQEISEVIGVNKGSVGAILLRAMRRFRREYEGKGESRDEVL